MREKKSSVHPAVYDIASRSVVKRGSEAHPNTTYYENIYIIFSRWNGVFYSFPRGSTLTAGPPEPFRFHP